LSNIYLREVLDKWFVETVRPLMKGKTFTARYADDAIIGCEKKSERRSADAGRIMKGKSPPVCQIRADHTPGEDEAGRLHQTGR
jgi:hypothetical protein